MNNIIVLHETWGLCFAFLVGSWDEFWCIRIQLAGENLQGKKKLLKTLCINSQTLTSQITTSKKNFQDALHLIFFLSYMYQICDSIILFKFQEYKNFCCNFMKLTIVNNMRVKFLNLQGMILTTLWSFLAFNFKRNL